MIIIPAKYSSSRLPEKNFRIFFRNLSLLQICILRCVKSNLGPVVVSSERPDLVVKQVAELSDDVVTRQTIVHSRTEKLARDPSTIVDVISDILSTNITKSSDNIVCVLPTSPFNSADFINKAYKVFMSSNADRLLSVSESDKPPYNAWVYSNNDSLDITHAFPDNPYRNVQSTRCPTTLYSNGCISIFKNSYFTSEKNRNNIIGFKMPQESSIDIDFEFEYKLSQLSFEEFATDLSFLKSYCEHKYNGR